MTFPVRASFAYHAATVGFHERSGSAGEDCVSSMQSPITLHSCYSPRSISGHYVRDCQLPDIP